ncbi:MAG: glycosyltransferase family 9 protein [Candidatus Rokuibacteriota bacterium]
MRAGRERETGAIRRLALVKLSSLGDVVHAFPAAHALRARFPDAELTWIVERREAAIVAGNPDLDHVIAVDTRLWRREFRRPGGPAAVFAKVRGLVRRLAAGRFDTALDFQGNWKSGLITALTRAPLRIGLAARDCREAGNALFTNRRVPLPRRRIHVVEEHFVLLSALGIARAAAGAAAFPITIDPATDAIVGRFLEEEGIKPETPLAALTPGSGGDRKRWAIAAYRRVADEVALRFGARIVLCWGPGEEPLVRAIAHGMRAAPLIPPPTSIPELVALLRRMTLAVGGDTGPIHIAAALGVPTLGLYGPTPAARNGPYGPRTATVQSPTGRMEDIRVETVIAAAESLVR